MESIARKLGIPKRQVCTKALELKSSKLPRGTKRKLIFDFDASLDRKRPGKRRKFINLDYRVKEKYGLNIKIQ